MCHCAPVLSIHNTASKTRRVGSACVQDVHRGYALPENDSGCAPTARLSAESSDIYSRSTPPSNFEIGSNHQLELGRLHNRQLGDLGTFQNSCRVNADQSKGIGQARSITDQATPSGCFRGKSARRSGSQLADKPLAVAEKARSFANC